MTSPLHSKQIKLATITTLSLAMSSCIWMKPATTRVSEARNSISADYLKQIRQHNSNTHGKTLKITWQQGLEKMFLTNPNLIQADYRLEDSKERQKQVWKNMIPGLNVGISDSATVKNLGDLFSGSSFRISSFISLGNLLELPSTIYTNKLTFMGSALQAENTMRQQVLSMYRLFQEQRLHLLEQKALNLEAEILKGVTGIEGNELVALKLKYKQAYKKWEDNVKTWKGKVGDFFMTGYDEVFLNPKGIPKITYNPSELNFTDTSRWGLLQLNLLALESIAEDGRILDTYLRYVPRANLSVSAPPLYNNTSNQSFDPALIRLGPSFNWSLDSRGSISRQLNRIKRNKPLQDWRKDKRTREEVAKLFDGKKQLIEVKEELNKLHKAVEVYKKAVREGLVKNPEKAVQTMRKLKEKEVRLLAKEIEICSAFWLIDERRWRPITKRWLETRKNRTQARKNNSKNDNLSFKNQVKKWIGKKKKKQ